MMFRFLKNNSSHSSGNLAKKRLNNILVTDRLKISPALMDQIKLRIQDSIGQYVEIGEGGVELELSNNSGVVSISTTVPIKQLKKR